MTAMRIKDTRRERLPFALLVLAAAISVSTMAHADSITVVTNSTGFGNDVLDWSTFGPDGTDVFMPSTATSAGGVAVTVSQPEYMMDIGESGVDFAGDFSLGTYLLTNGNTPPPSPVTITFGAPIYGVGAQIEPAKVYGDFTASIYAYDGSTLLTMGAVHGDKQNTYSGSAPFLGVESDAPEITGIVYSYTSDQNAFDPGGLGIGPLAIETTDPVPEPPSLALLLGGLLFVLCWAWAGRGPLRHAKVQPCGDARRSGERVGVAAASKTERCSR
jgi:hypothetical protein